jgi:hypothetical protein
MKRLRGVGRLGRGLSVVVSIVVGGVALEGKVARMSSESDER